MVVKEGGYVYWHGCRQRGKRGVGSLQTFSFGGVYFLKELK